MPRSDLDRARDLLAKGRHAEALRLLEPLVPLYRDSASFFCLLGEACLRARDLGAASSYLRRARQLEPLDDRAALLLALLHARRGEADKAVTLYLEVQERSPADKVAARGLALVRASPGPEPLAARAQAAAELFPPRLGPPPWLKPAAIVAILALACIILGPPLVRAAGRLARGLGREWALARAPRPEIQAVELSRAEREAPVGTAGSFRYVLTEEEALETFERAKARFQDYRDNAALVELNRLLASNATKAVKDKAATLKSYVAEPEFGNLRDVPPFALVAKEPWLYEGCAVDWRGRAANLVRGAEGEAFDFLVGYDTKSRLEGIVEAGLPPGPRVPEEGAFELLARIREGGRGFKLEGIAIHELLE